MSYLIQTPVTGHYPSRVPPFGNPWISAYVRLPTAYRSLSRPSSAISALASTLRSCSLDLASSRQLSLPKTIESDNQLKDCLLFVSSLCSFQGAPPAAPLRVAATRVDILRNRQPLVALKSAPSGDRSINLSSILQNDTEIIHFVPVKSSRLLAGKLSFRHLVSLLPTFPSACRSFRLPAVRFRTVDLGYGSFFTCHFSLERR